MKRLAYIGLKQDGERAFKERTGIEWMPGAEHDVQDEHAEMMLKHTDVWREVLPKARKVAAAPQAPAADAALGAAGAAGSAATSTDEAAVLPEWAKKGVELGATDEQLEAIAQAGGPETEQGAALWKDSTGTDWKAAAEAGASKSQVKRVAAQKEPAAKKVPAKKAAKKTSRKSAKKAAE